jgi:hypothetical protein
MRWSSETAKDTDRRPRRDGALWLGKTRGYQHLKDRTLAPAPVLTHPDR